MRADVRILLMDDDEELRKLTSKKLSAWGLKSKRPRKAIRP